MQNYNYQPSKRWLLLLFLTLALPIITHRQTAVSQAAFSPGPIIVLDAGHGGYDHGASGSLLKEKQICLAVVQKTGWILNERFPEAAVYYTRISDEFVPLHRRAALANNVNADLFISVHCNALPQKNQSIRGTETYVMGLHKAADNLEVAKRENASALDEEDYHSHYGGIDPNSPEGHILFNQYQSQYWEKSIEFAKILEAEFSKKHPGRSRGVKQAGFLLLHQISMPGVLTEIGYLSNAGDEKYLQSLRGQLEIAHMLAEAIIQYFKGAHPASANSHLAVKSPVLPDATPKSPIEPLADVDPTETIGPAGLKKFRVQIAASKDKLINTNHPIWKKAPEYVISHENDYFKYLVGSFDHRHEAEKERDRLRALGFTDAFVVAYIGEQRVK